MRWVTFAVSALVVASGIWGAGPPPDDADPAALVRQLGRRLAGRTAAWVAMAPKHDWPAVAALFGACQAIGRPRVVAAVAAALPEPGVCAAEPGGAPDRGGGK
jgi:hypothetical protein